MDVTIKSSKEKGGVVANYDILTSIFLNFLQFKIFHISVPFDILLMSHISHSLQIYAKYRELHFFVL